MPADGEQAGGAANAAAAPPPPATAPDQPPSGSGQAPADAAAAAAAQEAAPPLDDDALLASFFAEVRAADRDAEVDRVLGAFKLNPYEQVGVRFDADAAAVTRAYRKVRWTDGRVVGGVIWWVWVGRGGWESQGARFLTSLPPLALSPFLPFPLFSGLPPRPPGQVRPPRRPGCL